MRGGIDSAIESMSVKTIRIGIPFNAASQIHEHGVARVITCPCCGFSSSRLEGLKSSADAQRLFYVLLFHFFTIFIYVFIRLRYISLLGSIGHKLGLYHGIFWEFQSQSTSLTLRALRHV